MSREVHMMTPDGREMTWSPKLDYIVAIPPIATGIVSLIHRDALSPVGIETLCVGIALLPWLLLYAHVRLPRWLFAAIVWGGLFGLAIVGDTTGHDISPFLLVFLSAEMGAVAPPAESIAITAVSLGLIAGLEMTEHFMDGLPWYIGISLGWVGGYMFQSQVRVLSELKGAQAHLAERAAADERQRIARDLHDVIAHSLTVTMLHITGARKALARDPEEAAEALEEAERQGRQSLADVRRVVGVLGRSEDRAAPPEAADVTRLVEQFRNAGIEVAMDVDGRLGSISATTGLAVYRILQESLTNVVKHSPGAPAAVNISVDPEAVSLTVENRMTDGRVEHADDNHGLGLDGMRERAVLVGGTFRAGPHNGTWMVEATLPQTEEA